MPSAPRGHPIPPWRGLAASAAGLALVAALTGCAEPRWEYDKRGVSAVKTERDLRECRGEAFDPQRVTVFGPRVDQGRLNRCMEGRGYTARPAQ